MNLIGRASVADDARARLYNRVAWRILPMMLAGYTLANLDRVNVAFAKLQMSKAIGLSDSMYGFGAGVFFLSYALVEIPSNMTLHRVGARLWLGRIMIVWGLVSSATMLVHTPHQFYAIRLLLGVAEAGFYPGVLLFLTLWFPRNLRAQATSIMLLGSSLASLVGSPISGAVMHYLDGAAGLAGWQWLFVVEGVPASVLGIIVLLVLRDRPGEAAWLSAKEKALLSTDLEAGLVELPPGRDRFGDAFRNANIWCVVLANFCNLSTLYGIQFWLPTIIQKGIGGSVLTTGLIASAMSVVPCLVLLANARHSDRTRERRWHAVTGFAFSFVGLAVAGAFGGHIAVCLAGLLAAQCGFVIVSGTIFSLPGTFVTGAAAAAGFALITTIGNVVGYTTPYLIGVLHDATGSFGAGFYLMSLMSVIGSATILLMPALRAPPNASLPTAPQGE